MNSVSVTIDQIGSGTYALPQRDSRRPEDMPPEGMGLDNDPLVFRWDVTNSGGAPVNITVANIKELLDGLLLRREWRGGSAGTTLIPTVSAKILRPFLGFFGYPLSLAVVAAPVGASVLTIELKFPLVAIPRLNRPQKGWRAHPGVLLMTDWSFKRVSEPVIANITFGDLTITQTPVPLPARRLLFACPPIYTNRVGDRAEIDGNPGLIIAARALVDPATVPNIIVRAGKWTLIDQADLQEVDSSMFPAIADFTDESDLDQGALIYAQPSEPTSDDLVMGPIRVAQKGANQAPAIGLEELIIPALDRDTLEAHAVAFRKIMADAQGPWALNGRSISFAPLGGQGIRGYDAQRVLSSVEPSVVLVGASPDEPHTPLLPNGFGATIIPPNIKGNLDRMTRTEAAATKAQIVPGGFNVDTLAPMNVDKFTA